MENFAQQAKDWLWAACALIVLTSLWIFGFSIAEFLAQLGL